MVPADRCLHNYKTPFSLHFPYLSVMTHASRRELHGRLSRQSTANYNTIVNNSNFISDLLFN